MSSLMVLGPNITDNKIPIITGGIIKSQLGEPGSIVMSKITHPPKAKGAKQKPIKNLEMAGTFKNCSFASARLPNPNEIITS
ncbi:MAG: hypothetical protein C3F13_06595 [Anaerolineales bacterium]|nr:MAG: hypothetical protein C3F13_06595 [Anaerolineales bacterium]